MTSNNTKLSDQYIKLKSIENILGRQWGVLTFAYHFSIGDCYILFHRIDCDKYFIVYQRDMYHFMERRTPVEDSVPIMSYPDEESVIFHIDMVYN